MKKKMMIMMAVVLLLGCFVVPSADAAATWYICDVTSVGVGGGNMFLQVTDQGSVFSNKWTIIGGTKTEINQTLAVILTATQMGKPLYVHLDADASYPTVRYVYLFISGSLF